MRAYVTGGTGFVGSNIVKVFSERHGAEVHCPVHRFVPADASGFTTERLDLLDDDALLASVASFEPDVIVHSMILNDFAAMYADRDLAWRSYVGTTETLARAADEVGANYGPGPLGCGRGGRVPDPLRHQSDGAAHEGSSQLRTARHPRAAESIPPRALHRRLGRGVSSWLLFRHAVCREPGPPRRAASQILCATCVDI